MIYVKPLRQKLGVPTLVMACVFMVLVLSAVMNFSIMTPRGFIQTEAIETIDFSKLDEPLSTLVTFAREKQLVGKNVSTFSSILNAKSLRAKALLESKYDIYNVILPAPAEKLTGPLRDCWPLLSVSAERRTGQIKGYSLYMQEF